MFTITSVTNVLCKVECLALHPLMSAEANTPSLSLWFLKGMMPDQSMGVAFQLT